uniref:Secreted protein n=1 Tax=Lutzomyia longipalpis TaxID=7200 RepID=A0A7G3B7P1_LUTLO
MNQIIILLYATLILFRATCVSSSGGWAPYRVRFPLFPHTGLFILLSMYKFVFFFLGEILCRFLLFYDVFCFLWLLEVGCGPLVLSVASWGQNVALLCGGFYRAGRVVSGTSRRSPRVGRSPSSGSSGTYNPLGTIQGEISSFQLLTSRIPAQTDPRSLHRLRDSL